MKKQKEGKTLMGRQAKDSPALFSFWIARSCHDKMRKAAKADGRTQSEWFRRLIEKELYTIKEEKKNARTQSKTR